MLFQMQASFERSGGLQDPVIFSGTVRANLDPFDTAGGDAVIWQALEQAGIASAVRELSVRILAILYGKSISNLGQFLSQPNPNPVAKFLTWETSMRLNHV